MCYLCPTSRLSWKIYKTIGAERDVQRQQQRAPTLRGMRDEQPKIDRQTERNSRKHNANLEKFQQQHDRSLGDDEQLTGDGRRPQIDAD